MVRYVPSPRGRGGFSSIADAVPSSEGVGPIVALRPKSARWPASYVDIKKYRPLPPEAFSLYNLHGRCNLG